MEKSKQYFGKEKENMMEIKPLQKVTWDKCSDNTKYITGVYEYLLSGKAVQEEKKVFSDIKKCIDHGYVVLFGKDWEKDWISTDMTRKQTRLSGHLVMRNAVPGKDCFLYWKERDFMQMERKKEFCICVRYVNPLFILKRKMAERRKFWR